MTMAYGWLFVFDISSPCLWFKSKNLQPIRAVLHSCWMAPCYIAVHRSTPTAVGNYCLVWVWTVVAGRPIYESLPLLIGPHLDSCCFLLPLTFMVFKTWNAGDRVCGGASIVCQTFEMCLQIFQRPLFSECLTTRSRVWIPALSQSINLKKQFFGNLHTESCY